MRQSIGITSGAFALHFRDIVKHLNMNPVKLSRMKSIDNCELIIFTGGSDINPEIYHQTNTSSYISAYSIMRDDFEVALLNIAISLGKKVLGVCRGHQLINAALGGQLIQEIATIQPHGGYHPLYDTSGIVGHFFENVNSIHHQGVVVPGVGLTPTSRYGGVIESTESEQILTVQFHPEVMEGKDTEDFFQYVLTEWVRQGRLNV